MNATAQNRLPVEQTTTTDQLDSMLDRMLEKADAVRGQITMTPDGVEFPDFAGVQRYARMLAMAGCVPPVKDDDPQQQIARASVCILLGRRVGLTPEQAVQSMYVINGRPTIFGDGPLAICRQHPAWDESGFKEYWEIDGQKSRTEPKPEDFKKDSTAFIIETLRKGASEPYVTRFSIAHAKQAGLIGGRNQALYGSYPQRMLKFRGRGYNLRDNFGDALKGIGIKELIDAEPKEEANGKPPAADPLAERLGLNGNGATIVNGGTTQPNAPPETKQEAPDQPKEAKPRKPKQEKPEPPAADAPATDGRMQDMGRLRLEADVSVEWLDAWCKSKSINLARPTNAQLDAVEALLREEIKGRANQSAE